MSVSTPQPAPCVHIYTKRIHQRPALITRQRINTSPQMVRFTQSFLCICTTVWVFVRRSPAGKGSLHVFFFLMQGQLRTRAQQQECNFYFPMFYADICAALWRCWVECSSALFRGNSRLMRARWGPHASPLTRRKMTDSELQPWWKRGNSRAAAAFSGHKRESIGIHLRLLLIGTCGYVHRRVSGFSLFLFVVNSL